MDQIQHSKPVPPFVKFCAANIPMVFDDSLSYYEALCALWKWLQTDVIDVINNNATVTEAYREDTLRYEQAVRELHDYVYNYFDNLDVQEEINHKLDEMVEDGTFDTLLANYLVICGGNAKQLGCAGDGVTDDTEAIQDAIDNLKALGVNKLVFPSGNYVISDTIEIPSNFELAGMKDSVLKYVGEGTSGNILEIIGEDADNYKENIVLDNLTIDGTGQEYKGGHTMSTPTVTDTDPMYKGLYAVRVIFAKNIIIKNCKFIDIYGDGIVLSKTFNARVENNYLKDVSSGNITYDGQTGYDNHGDAITAFSSFNIRFLNNTVTNNRVYQSGSVTAAIGKPCGRTGLEFEYPINQDYTNNDPDDVNHNAPEYSLIETTTVGDKEYRYQYGCIMEGNFVYGYTKGIHIESYVKCNIVNNTILFNHIGVMYSTDAGGNINSNYINPMGVGQAPQSGYDGYYGGIAISQYGANSSRYGVVVTGNTLEGEGKGVTIGCSNVTVTNNTFRSYNGVFTILANLSGIIVNNNTFNDEKLSSHGSPIYLYNVKSAMVNGNNVYSELGATSSISGNNISIINNIFTRICVYHENGGQNIICKDNTFTGTASDKTYQLHLNAPTDCLIDSNTFYLDDASYNSVHAIKTYGAVNRTTFSNNRIYLHNTRTDTYVITSVNVTYCKYLNNICHGNDSTRFINFYTTRQGIFENNSVDSDEGNVIWGSGFRGWNVVEKNIGKIHADGYYPNDSLGELVDLYYSKSEKFYKYNLNGSSTTIGWVCVGNGYYVTATWSSAAYTAGKLLKNSSGNVYKCITAGSGSSTVEPTQTSGTQAETDGYTWKYLGAVAVFKDLSI